MYSFSRGFASVLLMLTMLSAYAQSKVTVRLLYNTTQNRYEVYARPNFTTSNFAFGPSQISIVLPASAPDDPLTIQSVMAGTWVDNSIVLRPTAAPQADFHGITTQGGKANLTESQDLLLFAFTLKQGFLDGTRLFINGTDPGSDKPGMMGGDFQIYLSDSKGSNYAVVDPTAPSLSGTPGSSTTTTPGTSITTTTPGTSTTTTTPGTSATSTTSTTPNTSVVLAIPITTDPIISILAYPNPTPVGEIQVLLEGIPAAEPLRIRLLSLEGKVLTEMSLLAGELKKKRLPIPKNYTFLLLNVEQTKSGKRYTQRISVVQ